MTLMLARVTILGGRGDFHTQAFRNLHIYSMLRIVFQAPRYDLHVSQGYDFGGRGDFHTQSLQIVNTYSTLRFVFQAPYYGPYVS